MPFPFQEWCALPSVAVMPIGPFLVSLLQVRYFSWQHCLPYLACNFCIVLLQLVSTDPYGDPQDSV